MSARTPHRMTAGGHSITLVHDRPDECSMEVNELESLRSFSHVLTIASRLVVLQNVARRQLRRDLDALHAELAAPSPRLSIVTVLLDEIDRALRIGQLPESVRIILESGPKQRPNEIA